MKPIALVLLAGAVLAQNPEEGFRQLWNQELLNKRPPAKNPAESLSKKAVYKPVSKPGPVAVLLKKDSPKSETKLSAKPGDTLLGVTLWRLRPPRPAEPPKNARIIYLPASASKPEELIPERLETDTPVANGDKVRLTIEVPRTGYLYVIDREVYADGTASGPFLIYPNRLTRPGDNLVAAGRQMYIPDPRDNPSFFVVQRGKPNQTAEMFSILVTPEPL